MASDPTAGGAPAEMPVEPDDNLEIPAKPEGELQQLQAEKAELQDKLLRALAEAQNVRRRGQQDVERERKFGIERFAKDVLSVADNLGRALSALPDDGDAIDPALKNVLVGVQATERELQSVLERHVHRDQRRDADQSHGQAKGAAQGIREGRQDQPRIRRLLQQGEGDVRRRLTLAGPRASRPALVLVMGGRAPSSTAKMMTSTIASQKWGTLTPTSEISVTRRSTMRDLA